MHIALWRPAPLIMRPPLCTPWAVVCRTPRSWRSASVAVSVPLYRTCSAHAHRLPNSAPHDPAMPPHCHAAHLAARSGSLVAVLQLCPRPCVPQLDLLCSDSTRPPPPPASQAMDQWLIAAGAPPHSGWTAASLSFAGSALADDTTTADVVLCCRRAGSQADTSPSVGTSASPVGATSGVGAALDVVPFSPDSIPFGDRVPGHRCVLATGSDVLRSLLYPSAMRELALPRHVLITCCDADTLRIIKRWVYARDGSGVTADNALDVVRRRGDGGGGGGGGDEGLQARLRSQFCSPPPGCGVVGKGRGALRLEVTYA
jgi:hypothetical protein